MGKYTKTAILSVYDKTGLLDLAKGLVENNVRILASGGTANMVREAGFPVDDVSSITHAPEMLGGRVKTLHPAVHAGILARNLEGDEKDLKEQHIDKVDFVVCNLYPFKETVAKNWCYSSRSCRGDRHWRCDFVKSSRKEPFQSDYSFRP